MHASRLCPLWSPRGHHQLIQRPNLSRGCRPMNSAKEASAARQLDNAQRLLAVLEEQASGFTVLTIPAPLKVDLDNQRAKVAYLAERVGRSGSDGTRTPQQKRLPPNWSGQQ